MSFGPTTKSLPKGNGGTPKVSARNIRKRVIKDGWGAEEYENKDEIT